MFPLGTPKRAAEERARQVLAGAITGTLVKRSAGPVAVKLSDAFDAYLKWVATNRPKAHKQRKSIKAVWIETVGDVPIDRLDEALLETYKAKRQALKAAPATVNKGLRTVKHMAGVAVRSGWPWIGSRATSRAA